MIKDLYLRCIVDKGRYYLQWVVFDANQNVEQCIWTRNKDDTFIDRMASCLRLGASKDDLLEVEKRSIEDLLFDVRNQLIAQGRFDEDRLLLWKKLSGS